MVWNAEEGCMELWLGTPSRYIFPCLKPQCLGNGCAAGAFKGCSTDDGDPRLAKANRAVIFPEEASSLWGEEVSALLPLLEP